MALETLLIKVKTSISKTFHVVKPSVPYKHTKQSSKKSSICFLAFEIASLMSKLLHIWRSLSDKNLVRLKNESISLDGVRKIVSNDDSFLLRLACAEMVESLRLVAKAVSRISERCQDGKLRGFHELLEDFANLGRDPYGWMLSSKDMEVKIKKMDRYVSVTAMLHKEMDELNVLESSLRKNMQSNCNKDVDKEQKIADIEQKIVWQRQEVKHLKETSLWNQDFDSVTSIIVRIIFSVLARIKFVFGIGGQRYPISLSRSLSASATVHPSSEMNPSTCNSEFVSVPLRSSKLEELKAKKNSPDGFFKSNSKLLKPPRRTLGGAALALHYANLIIVIEKMIKSPHLVGLDARDDLYSMLPNSIRSSLRARLRGVGFSATDHVLAGEWREALGKILGWLSPLAHNMIKWQNERSFEQQNLMPKTSVLLLQTLFFANKEKAEAAITEMLVGLNYIWRFEREMTAKALFECANVSGLLNKQRHR